jgi:NADH:ubiquinone oxidoreductase subunit 4 (subunit M)
MFLLYTAVGSAFLLFAILLIFLEKQSTNFFYIFYNSDSFSEEKQQIL